MPEFGVSYSGESGIASSHNFIPAPRTSEPGLDTLAASRTWATFARHVAAGHRVRLAVDGKNYLCHDDRTLTARQPWCVAAVYIYHRGMARLLPGDFDIKRAIAVGTADPAALVEQEAADFAALIAHCGGDCFSDASPKGGRHVSVPWARPRPYAQTRPLAEALERRYVTFDPRPSRNEHDGLIWLRGAPLDSPTAPCGSVPSRETPTEQPLA